MTSVESRLEKLAIAHPSVTEILDGFNLASLRSIITAETQEDASKLKGIHLKNQIKSQITVIAARTLAESLSLEELKGALKNMKIDHEAVGNNPNSKRVHIKRFEEQLHEHGIEAFLSEKVEAAVQVSFCAALGLTPASSSNAETLAKQIANYLEYQAITAYFDAFDASFLHDIAFENKLETAEEQTSSKGVLIEVLFTNTNVKDLEKERPKQKTTKGKKPAKPKTIAKGVTYDALFQYYGVDELREWARENGIIVSGAKPDLINRIIAFLDGDKENTTAEGKEATRKAKSEEKKKAKAAKEAKLKAAAAAKGKPVAEKKKRIVKKKPEPVVEEEEEEEEVEEEAKPEPTTDKVVPAAQPQTTEEETKEEEEEDDRLDLDNLDSYTKADLQQYCEEEDIAFKSNATKKDLIAAINKYNDEDDEEEEDRQ